MFSTFTNDLWMFEKENKRKTISILLFLISLFENHYCDTYSGDGRDPFFTARPPVVDNYGQWGHYPILYENPNRPLENINKHDSRYSAVTPDTFNRYKIEDPGDLRCPEAVREGLTEFVPVATVYGTVVGRIVYLCDEPGVPEHERPRPAQYRPGGSPHQYRPITNFRRNVTAFLGIPYAKPPTRQNKLRFKVRNIEKFQSLMSFFLCRDHKFLTNGAP